MAQFDFEAGIDLTALTSVSQSQLMQAINQIAPLSNIGGVLFGLPATYDETFMVANPRCERYVLVDTTAEPYQLKTWQDSTNEWVSGTNNITAGSQIAFGILDIEGLDAAIHVDPGTATAKQVYRRNSAGTGFEFADPTELFTAGSDEVLLTFLEYTSATEGQLLAITSGVPAWIDYDPNADITAASLDLNKLKNGTANYLIARDSGGVVVEKSNDDSSGAGFLPAATTGVGINISKLRIPAGGAADAGKVLRAIDTTGASLEWEFNEKIKRVIAQPIGTAGGLIANVAHDLGGIPDVINAYLVTTATGAANTGFALGTRIKVDALTKSTGVVHPFVVSCSATNVAVTLSQDTPYTLVKSDGTAVFTFTLAAANTLDANFTLDIVAIKYRH